MFCLVKSDTPLVMAVAVAVAVVVVVVEEEIINIYCCYCYFIISVIQGIHTYIPETNYVYRVYTVAAILHLLFIGHIMLYSV
jgi:hypothetical protein